MSNQLVAAECLRGLIQRVGNVEYGYRVQGLAAHVLIRLGAVVTAINASGHPDIIATIIQRTVRIEIEADIGSHAHRRPTLEDLEAIRPKVNNDIGYCAYFISWPRMRWLLVPYESLASRRDPIPLATAAALAEPTLSMAWSEAMVSIVAERCEKLWSYSFGSLCRRALAGQGL